MENLTIGDELNAAYSLFWFDDLLQDVIHQVKYNGYKRFANYLINSFADEIQKLLIGCNICAMLPVPLHKVKKRERGYNQAEVIAKSIGRIIHLPVENNLLKRTRWTQTQTKLDIEDRKKNTYNAFAVVKNITYKRILLVDDVLTTGATANACATVMKNAGTDWVGVFTLGTPLVEN